MDPNIALLISALRLERVRSIAQLRGRIGGFVRAEGEPCDAAALASSMGHVFVG